jgi:transcriptional regulator with XRE-family HTH domain
MDQQVALRIRARRTDQGITLQALACHIGVGFRQAHKYERGLSRISAGRLYHVACALSAPIGLFFTTGPLREEGGARPNAPSRISADASVAAAETRTVDKQPAELMDKQVALRIRARRIDQGITLQALARQIGVAFQQAHKYERGLSRISAGRLYHVACALSVPIGFFFTTLPLREEARPEAGGATRAEPDGAAGATHHAGDLA